jgi:caa(3)-type oxidase subunit IV
MSGAPAPHAQAPHASARLYVLIWVWLAGLMLLGVFVSESPVFSLPGQAVVLIVLSLSLIKAFLVAMYYMHLKTDRRPLLLIALAPFILIALAVLLIASSALVRL